MMQEPDMSRRYECFSVCEICDDFFQHGAIEFGGNYYHWDCLNRCHACHQDFLAGEPLMVQDGFWVHAIQEGCVYEDTCHAEDEEAPLSYESLTGTLQERPGLFQTPL